MTGTPTATHTAALQSYLSGETIRVALFDDSTAYTFDPDNHEFVSDILDGGTTAQELQGSAGYTGQSDRKTLQNLTFLTDRTDDQAEFDADDVTWAGVESTESIQGYIVYRQVGGDDTTPGDDEVLVVVDDDMADAPSKLPLATNGSDITIQINAEGVITQVSV